MPPMHVAVCVKQIPDPASPGKLDPGTNTLVRQGKLVIDDSDMYGVEMALQLVQQAGGGEVTVISMAPNQRDQRASRTLSPWAPTRRIVISDDALQGSDALATAKVLAPPCKRAGDVDLVARRHRVDRRLHGHDAGAGRRAARPSLGHLRQEGDDRRVEGHRRAPDRVGLRRGGVAAAGGRHRDRRRGRAPLPLVQAIMAAKNKPIDQVSLGDLGIDAGTRRLGRRPPGDHRRRRRRGPPGRRDHRRRRRRSYQDRCSTSRS